MKTAISIPDDVFAQVEQAVKEAGMSRSEFYRNAATHYLAHLQERDLTRELDNYIAVTGDDGADPQWAALSKRGLGLPAERDAW